ncbi:substrate-binding domain-containing protein [Acidiphilium sp.]|uniref:substrate-binding domain-containing protein n=1 Tax=Acidiphilium sp. TaxID=527 RepID=UPI00258B5D22|nr:substrate-binding domain-containing protein [Acidiphilium sp.]
MTEKYLRHVFGGPAARRGIGMVALIGAACAAGPAMAQTRSQPYPAWPDPVISPTLSVAEAKAIVVERTKKQTEWKGPSDGPRAPAGSVTIAYVSPDQSYTPHVLWGRGVEEAAKALGWKVMTLNGQGTVSGTLSAMQQALAANPTAIVTPADANALQKPIKEAVARHIPVIGIHATAFPGPHPDLGLYMNIVSNPAEIGQTEAAYVIAMADGKARDIHMVDDSYAIARFKAKATTTPIANCSGCKMLETVNMPLGDASARMSSVVSGLLARYGDSWWMTTCCDGYYTNVAAALRAAGASPTKIKLVGADAPPSAYDMIRKGGFEVASVPEPSSLFGYMAVDAVIRAMAGQEPAHFVQPTFLIVKENVDSEGGRKNEFVPSNNFACHYMNVWKGTNNPC